MDDEKQCILENILVDLSTSQNLLETNIDEFIGKLKEVYGDKEFRHMYSGFYATITVIDAESNLDILSQNIGILYRKIRHDYEESTTNISENTYRGITKFYDHVNLDIARINYLRGVSKTAEELKQQVTETRKESSQLMKKAAGMQKEYIAILGIFSAIIVSFFSGIGFSSSVLANINASSIYRLLFVVVLEGVVLFNLLGLLTNFIYKIVDIRNDYKKLHVYGNLFLLIILLAVFMAWKFQVLGYAQF